ncbi:MAG: GNAT family N-acetyltransferase [Cyanobacteria bacterium P01_D01_bin.50]
MFSYINERRMGLAPLAVHPDFQKQGIGNTLVNFGLNKANELGEVLIIV